MKIQPLVLASVIFVLFNLKTRKVQTNFLDTETTVLRKKLSIALTTNRA